MINKNNNLNNGKASGPCPDEVFLGDLGLLDTARGGAAALVIRQVIADLADVSHTQICAHHSFSDDLAGLGMWDSLDTVEFVMRLEDRLQTRIPAAVAERLPGLLEQERANPLFTVSDMVLGMVS